MRRRIRPANPRATLRDLVTGELCALVGVAIAGASAAAAYSVRYAFIEPAEMGAACEAGGSVSVPAWCGLRLTLIVATRWNGFGWAAMACAAIAILLRARDVRRAMPSVGIAWAAMACGGAGLVLYNATLSGIALIGAGMLLARASVPSRR
jgi:hypothetical protein